MDTWTWIVVAVAVMAVAAFVVAVVTTPQGRKQPAWPAAQDGDEVERG